LPHRPRQPSDPASQLTVEAARAAIAALRADIASRGESEDLFGLEHSEHLAGILGAIEQTFDGVPIYPSTQSRAAHLLYFVVKDHPFVDGNKRIGALLFLSYLRETICWTSLATSRRWMQTRWSRSHCSSQKAIRARKA
jgi:hypothetical protein